MSSLTMKQREAAYLLASGSSNADTAEQLRINPATLYRWRQRPDFAEQYSRLVTEQEREANSRLSALKGKAVERLAKLLEDKNPSVALKAIDMVIGRSLGVPTENQSHQEELQSADVREFNAALVQRLKGMTRQRNGMATRNEIACS